MDQWGHNQWGQTRLVAINGGINGGGSMGSDSIEGSMGSMGSDPIEGDHPRRPKDQSGQDQSGQTRSKAMTRDGRGNRLTWTDPSDHAPRPTAMCSTACMSLFANNLSPRSDADSIRSLPIGPASRGALRQFAVRRRMLDDTSRVLRGARWPRFGLALDAAVRWRLQRARVSGSAAGTRFAEIVRSRSSREPDL